MRHTDYDSLLSSLDHALEILARNRSPDPIVVAAHDSLKQTKAIVVRALHPSRETTQRERADEPLAFAVA